MATRPEAEMTEEELAAERERVWAELEAEAERRAVEKLERIRLHGRTAEDDAETLELLRGVVQMWKEEWEPYFERKKRGEVKEEEDP